MNAAGIRAAGRKIVLSAITATMFASQVVLPADVTSLPSGVDVRIDGIYKVVSSSDPLFQVTGTREYFLDFGSGARRNKLSGNVAISLRQNPSVKVRIMAWEYFPAQETLLIGNPFAEGSRKAVGIGAWRVRGFSGGLVWQRGNHQIVLCRPDPGNY
jgi:hypothetical protein